MRKMGLIRFLLVTGVVSGATLASTLFNGHWSGPVSAVSGTGGTLGNGATVIHFSGKGDGAWASGWQGDTYFDISVNRDGSGKNLRTWLYYNVVMYSCPPGGTGGTTGCGYYTVAAGSGLVPSDDLAGHGNSRLSLDTDTSSNPDFSTWAGTTGRIAFDWSKNGLFSSQSTYNTQERYADGTKAHWNGSGKYTSADAEGTIVGIAISLTPSGRLWTDHRVNHQVTPPTRPN